MLMKTLEINRPPLFVMENRGGLLVGKIFSQVA